MQSTARYLQTATRCKLRRGDGMRARYARGPPHHAGGTVDFVQALANTTCAYPRHPFKEIRGNAENATQVHALRLATKFIFFKYSLIYCVHLVEE